MRGHYIGPCNYEDNESELRSVAFRCIRLNSGPAIRIEAYLEVRDWAVWVILAFD